ncbi:MAG: hypothetical protein KGJ57_22510 [Sphingomonadales bacterium]|nr:hypothetical protein [Sphingomonadales bacterium]MDE2172158.1 hypothetical protein [Sphingomonadales bacterium]
MAMDDPGFGEANRQTMAAQIIDPVPPPETLAQNGSGDHVQAALERYRTDAVKRPDRVRTSTVASGGGGSGGSSSSR